MAHKHWCKALDRKQSSGGYPFTPEVFEAILQNLTENSICAERPRVSLRLLRRLQYQEFLNLSLNMRYILMKSVNNNWKIYYVSRKKEMWIWAIGLLHTQVSTSAVFYHNDIEWNTSWLKSFTGLQYKKVGFGFFFVTFRRLKKRDAPLLVAKAYARDEKRPCLIE